jgi:hypothetical protein
MQISGLRCADGWSVHSQNNTKACLASHHLRVSISRLIERDRLNHGGHATQRTETKRRVTCRRVSCQSTFELAAPEYEIHGRDLDRLRPDAENDRDTAGAQPLEGLGDGLATGSRYQNDFGAAERLQSLGGVGSGIVDVMMPSFRANSTLSSPRAIAATSNPICRAYCTPR